MLTSDWPPNRLQAAIDAGLEFLRVKAKHRPNDHVGAVSFNLNAEVMHTPVPVAANLLSLELRLRSICIDRCTNIGEGLRCAGNSIGVYPGAMASLVQDVRQALATGTHWVGLRSSPAIDPERVIVLLTDGESNTGPAPLEVATSLKRAKVAIWVVGIADRSALPEDLLRKIASPDADGTPMYWFIADRAGLLDRFRQLACYLRRM